MQQRSIIAPHQHQLPTFLVTHYRKNINGSYTKITGELPDELFLQKTISYQIGANWVLMQRDGIKVKMFSGLRNTVYSNWFTGNHFAQGCRSLILVNFNADNSKMNVFKFSGFNKKGAGLKRFTDTSIAHLLPYLQ